jgi:hypothetical protein
MGFLDSILGKDQQRKLGLADPPTPTRASVIEADVARLLPILAEQNLRAPPTALPINESGPLAFFTLEAARVQGPGWASLDNARQPITVPLSGERILLRRTGTPPGARVVLDIGGKTANLQPGQEIVAPFRSFQVINRNHGISAELAGNAGGFQGEMAFVVCKTRSIEFVEPGSFDNSDPWFNWLNIWGDVLNAQTAFGTRGWDGPLSTITNSRRLCSGGARRMRLFLSLNPYPDNAPGTIVNGDTVTVDFFEMVQGYEDGNATAQFMQVLGPSGAWRADKSFTFTWAQNQHSFDIDLSNTSPVFGLTFTISAGHTLYAAALGVP